jgi:hypothetical protein
VLKAIYSNKAEYIFRKIRVEKEAFVRFVVVHNRMKYGTVKVKISL